MRVTDGVLSLLVVFLLLAATVVYSGQLLGIDFVKAPVYSEADLLPTESEQRELGIFNYGFRAAGPGIWNLIKYSGRQVGVLINSRPYTDGVVGFAGPTPVWVFINAEGRVERILPCQNGESVDFLRRAIDGGILTRWEGVLPGEADKVNVDAVSGATYSSRALTDNVRAALAVYANRQNVSESVPAIGWGRTAAVAVVLLFGIYVSLYRKGDRRWLLAQRLLNVGVTGFWCGQFLSVSLLRGWLRGGLDVVVFLPTVLLLAIAVLMPLIGRRRYYCTWVCPYGSLQTLAYAIPVPKLKLSARTVKFMHRLRTVILAALLLSMWLGVGAWLLDYEPFTAFLFTTAAPAVIVLAAAFVVLAMFVPTPWCQAICPMGELLSLAEPSKIRKQ